MIVPAKERGWFPSNYVTQLSEAEANWAREQLEAEESANLAREEHDPLAATRAISKRQDSDLENVLWAGLNGLATDGRGLDAEDMTFSTGGDIFAEIAGAAAASSAAADEGSSDDASDVPVISTRQSLDSKATSDEASADFWIPRVTPDGQIFYYNSRTGQTSRDLPIDASLDADGALGPIGSLEGDLPTGRLGESTESLESLSGFGGLQVSDDIDPSATLRHSQRAAIAPVPAADDGWALRTLDDGRTQYYENRFTGERRWSPPTPAAAGAPSAMIINSSQSSFGDSSPQIPSRSDTGLGTSEDPRMSMYSDDSALDAGPKLGLKKGLYRRTIARRQRRRPRSS